MGPLDDELSVSRLGPNTRGKWVHSTHRRCRGLVEHRVCRWGAKFTRQAAGVGVNVTWDMCLWLQLSSMQCACALLCYRLWSVRLYHIFPHYLINVPIFWKKGCRTKNVRFDFSLQNFSEIFLIPTRTERDDINVQTPSRKVPVSLVIKLAFPLQNLQIYNFMKIRPVEKDLFHCYICRGKPNILPTTLPRISRNTSTILRLPRCIYHMKYYLINRINYFICKSNNIPIHHMRKNHIKSANSIPYTHKQLSRMITKFPTSRTQLLRTPNHLTN
jgi:hypothetical protein